MELLISGKSVNWTPSQLLIAGYTGRDQTAVQQHIDELKKIGVPAPKRIPMIYEVSPELLQTNDLITVIGNKSSGEAEVALLNIDGKWYVGLGSDHTDRLLETVSVQKSKQVCAKPLARELWPLDEVIKSWDEIELKSWVTVNGDKKLYQSGKLDQFLPPEQLLKFLEEQDYVTKGMAMFCGTLPLIDGVFLYGQRFQAELHDPHKKRVITLDYKVKQLKDVEEE